MLIRSKKTGLEHSITTEEWNKLVESKDSLQFTVIDKGEQLSKKTMIPLPEIEEYKKTVQKKTNKPTSK